MLGPSPRHPVLVGVDLRPEAWDAVRLGSDLARAAGAELVLVGVDPDPVFPVPSSSSRNALLEETTSRLRSLADALVPGARVVSKFDISVARGLEIAAEEEHAGVLVVGSSRSAEPGRVAIGRRTRQLLHHAARPLAVAPRRYGEDGGAHLKVIGAGYDEAPESVDAMRLAATLALGAGATLRVRSVLADVPPVGWVGFAYASPPVDWAAIVDKERAEVQERLKEAAHDLPGDVELDTILGDPVGELRRFAHEVDLLVLGSRRWGTFARVVLGSVGESVLRGAACPVLVTPRRAEAASAAHGQRAAA